MHLPTAPDLEAQLAVREVASAADALDAHRQFERNLDRLEDWQVIFADLADVGSVKLLDVILGDSVRATTVFRGRSLWLMDAPFVASGGKTKVAIRGGSGIYLDSNAASHIRSVAYEAHPPVAALTAALAINQLGARIQNINPALYLYECWRRWDKETVAACRQTLAAIHALSSSGGPLTLEWGRRFQTEFREQSEFMADALIAEFENDLQNNGLTETLSHETALMEILLIQTQIIQLSSAKQLPHKLSDLINFMHEKLATIALRELVVCGDILARSKGSRIAKKLNSLQNHPSPFDRLQNCAWDMFIPRALDRLGTVERVQSGLDFYLAEILTFDGDVGDMIHNSRLRALAVHRPTMMCFPFFDNDVAEWIGNRVGTKRLRLLEPLFQPEAFIDRAQRRDPSLVQELVRDSRDQLAHLLRSL